MSTGSDWHWLTGAIENDHHILAMNESWLGLPTTRTTVFRQCPYGYIKTMIDRPLWQYPYLMAMTGYRLCTLRRAAMSDSMAYSSM